MSHSPVFIILFYFETCLQFVPLSNSLPYESEVYLDDGLIDIHYNDVFNLRHQAIFIRFSIYQFICIYDVCYSYLVIMCYIRHQTTCNFIK